MTPLRGDARGRLRSVLHAYMDFPRFLARSIHHVGLCLIVDAYLAAYLTHGLRTVLDADLSPGGRIRLLPQMHTASGSPRPSARTDNLVPRQGQIPLSRRLLQKSSYFRRTAPRPATSPHVPERQLLLTREEVDLKGFEPSPLTLTGSYAAVTPQAHAESISHKPRGTAVPK